MKDDFRIGFNVQMELLKFALREKLVGELRMYLYAKHHMQLVDRKTGKKLENGLVKITGQIKALKECKNTQRKRLKKLIDLGWFKPTKRQNVYHTVAHHKALKEVRTSKRETVKKLDKTQVRSYVNLPLKALVSTQFKELVLACFIKKSVARQKWHYKQRSNTGHFGTNGPDPLARSRVFIPTFSCAALARLLQVTISNASRWRRRIQRAGYICLEARRTFLSDSNINDVLVLQKGIEAKEYYSYAFSCGVRPESSLVTVTDRDLIRFKRMSL